MENKLKKISVVSSDKILKSRKFNDFYFNSINPIDECKYVYINANNLIQKINQTSNLVIGELGFGIGLNFLMTIKSLENKLINNKQLHYISFEGYPLEHKKLKEIYSNFKELNIIRDLNDTVDNWKYEKLNETYRISGYIKSKIKNYDIS